MKSIVDQKLSEILKKAKDLFWKQGFKRVSIEEVCSAANVSKMTFYKHFKNKNELIKYLINDITENAMTKYSEIMKSNIPFSEKVKKTIDLKLESSQDMSNEFFNDYFRHADPDMLEFLRKKTNELMVTILNDYSIAQKNGDVRKDIKPEFIIYILNNLTEMAKDERLEKLYNSPQEILIEFTNFFFYGILPRAEDQ